MKSGKSLTIIPSANEKIQAQAAKLRSQCKEVLEQREKEKSLMQECEDQAKRIEDLKDEQAQNKADIEKYREQSADREALRRELDDVMKQNTLNNEVHSEMREAEKQNSLGELASMRQNIIRKEHAIQAKSYEAEEAALRRLKEKLESVASEEKAQAREEIEELEKEENELKLSTRRLKDLEIDMEKEHILARAKYLEANQKVKSLCGEIEHIQAASRSELEAARTLLERRKAL